MVLFYYVELEVGLWLAPRGKLNIYHQHSAVPTFTNAIHDESGPNPEPKQGSSSIQNGFILREIRGDPHNPGCREGFRVGQCGSCGSHPHTSLCLDLGSFVVSFFGFFAG